MCSLSSHHSLTEGGKQVYEDLLPQKWLMNPGNIDICISCLQFLNYSLFRENWLRSTCLLHATQPNKFPVWKRKHSKIPFVTTLPSMHITNATSYSRLWHLNPYFQIPILCESSGLADTVLALEWEIIKFESYLWTCVNLG